MITSLSGNDKYNLARVLYLIRVEKLSTANYHLVKREGSEEAVEIASELNLKAMNSLFLTSPLIGSELIDEELLTRVKNLCRAVGHPEFKLHSLSLAEFRIECRLIESECRLINSGEVAQ